LRLSGESFTVNPKNGLPPGSIGNGELNVNVVLAVGGLVVTGLGRGTPLTSKKLGGSFEGVGSTAAGGFRVADENSDGLLNETVTALTNTTTHDVLVMLKTPASMVWPAAAPPSAGEMMDTVRDGGTVTDGGTETHPWKVRRPSAYAAGRANARTIATATADAKATRARILPPIMGGEVTTPSTKAPAAAAKG
jgi:hypothetical protein